MKASCHIFFACLLVNNVIGTNLYAQSQRSFLEINAESNIANLKIDGRTRLINLTPIISEKPVISEMKMAGINDIIFQEKEQSVSIKVYPSESTQIIGLYLAGSKTDSIDGSKFCGLTFDSIVGFTRGVQLWRYKPWNSWTIPIKVNAVDQLEDWDVQFFYWQFDDGLYGGAIPLSGNGFRTTLGSINGKFGCKSYSYISSSRADSIPLLALGIGEDPYLLFERLYREGLRMIGKEEDLRKLKTYPVQLEYLGWCTWNAFGENVNEKSIIDGVKSFQTGNLQLGSLLIDDGYFDQTDRKLNSFYPDKIKFPNGFRSLNNILKDSLGLKYTGIWHSLNGYWNGLNPMSDIGNEFAQDLFTWKEKEVTCDFIKPDSPDLFRFYQKLHKYFKSEGFSYVKVDNQVITERMSVNNYPIGKLSEDMHVALNKSVFESFDGGIINCMCMTNEAFYNFGKTAVARCVVDYREVDEGRGYNLEKGATAAHVLSALYNSLYFSQMVWPDFDMFESYHTYAIFHAIARAISGGPIYVTDKPGKQDFELLSYLADWRGKIYRVDQPALLTEDCLFQVQDASLLKAFSFARQAGLLGVWNAADADEVKGSFSPMDLKGLKGEKFVAYEHVNKQILFLTKNDTIPLTLKRMKCLYYNIVPINYGVALIGLLNKYNSPKTILSFNIEKERILVKLNESGLFGAVLPHIPQKVFLNGELFKDYTFQDGVFKMTIENMPGGDSFPTIQIVL